MKKPSPSRVTYKALGEQFAAVMATWLTEQQRSLVRLRNRQHLEAGNLGVCATHDFCDANMAMDRACHDLGLDPLPSGAMTDELATLWGKAWSYAKRRHFTAPPTKKENV